MLKSTVIAILIAASSATSVLSSGALTGNVLGERPQTGERSSHSNGQSRVFYESGHCRTARRQIATYSRALSRLDVASTDNQLKIALYRRFRQTERDWFEQNCQPFKKTALN